MPEFPTLHLRNHEAVMSNYVKTVVSNYVKIRVHKVDEGGSVYFCVSDSGVIDYGDPRVLGVKWVAEGKRDFERMIVKIPDEFHWLFHNSDRGRPYEEGELPVLSVRTSDTSQLNFNRGMEGKGEIAFSYEVLCYPDEESRPVEAQTCAVEGASAEIPIPPRIIVRNVNPVSLGR